MSKLLLTLFCVLNLVVLLCATDYEGENFNNRQAYNLDSLIKKSLSRLQRFHSLKDESPELVIDLQFNGIDPDAEFEHHGNSSTNSSKCLDDIIYILLNIKSQWAISVFDSFGKPESGILQGNFKWAGDYNECINVHSTNPNSTVGNFHGKYCSLTWSLPVLNASLPLPFVTGICVPDSCSPEELQSIMQFSHVVGVVPVLNGTESFLKTSIACKSNERHLNAPAKAVIALLSIFCTLAVLGSSITVVKYFKKVIDDSKRSALVVNIAENDQTLINGSNAADKHFEKDDQALLPDNSATNENVLLGKLETVLVCFCVFTNGAKLLNTDSSEGQLLCIHGIRFLSMSWVILGHSYAFCFQQMKNMAEAIGLVDNLPFQIVLQGFYSVDSFFVLSGFLLAYLSMKEFAKSKGAISWPYFYIHRYIRLTPIYMIVLGFSASVYLYLGSGPFWPDNDVDANCRDSWWWNLLYINNFTGMAKQCMGWSWYLANDMQFFVISPLFLITLWRWPRIGYSVLATFLFACWFSNFFITYHYGLPPGMSGTMNDPNMLDMGQAMVKVLNYMDKIYIKPYTRIAPYLIGILTGYLLFKRNSSNSPKYSWVFLCVGWIVATTITLASVYGLYHRHPSEIASSFYNALHRTAFATGLSWVIYVCLIGQGGFVNKILSYKLFIPLSRLTYSAYLIHPMIITGYFGSLKTAFEFSHPSVVFLFLGFMLATYGLSLPVALILESPIVSLEKLIRKSFSRKQSS